MEPDKMLIQLKEKEENLKNELINLEQTFSVKKEQFLKIQGAIEALLALGSPEDAVLNSHPEE